MAEVRLPKLWPGAHDFAEDLRLSLEDARREATEKGFKVPPPHELLRIVLEHGYGFTHEDAVNYAHGEMRR